MNVIRHELASNSLLVRIMHLKYNFLHVASHFLYSWNPGLTGTESAHFRLPHLENGSLEPETEWVLLGELFQIKNTVSIRVSLFKDSF